MADGNPSSSSELSSSCLCAEGTQDNVTNLSSNGTLSYEAASTESKEALPKQYVADTMTSEALQLPGGSSSTLLNEVSMCTAPLLPQPMENLHGSLPPPFLTKTYEMIDDVTTDSIVSWSSRNSSFIVWNLSEFSQSLLPMYFKHNNFSSFVRQLNTYGFKKVNSNRFEFAHEAFLRGHKHMLKDIHRRKPRGQVLEQSDQLQQQQSVSARPASTVTFVEVGNYGLKGELDRLTRDKGVLAADVVRLRQQQEAVEQEARTMFQRLLAAERRNEQIITFLSQAIRSRAFLAHLMEQSEIFRMNCETKKRRLTSGITEPEEMNTIPQPHVLLETSKESLGFEKDMWGLKNQELMTLVEPRKTTKPHLSQSPGKMPQSMEAAVPLEFYSGSRQTSDIVDSLSLDYDSSDDSGGHQLFLQLDDDATDLDLTFDFLKELDPVFDSVASETDGSPNIGGETSNPCLQETEPPLNASIPAAEENRTGATVASEAGAGAGQ